MRRAWFRGIVGGDRNFFIHSPRYAQNPRQFLYRASRLAFRVPHDKKGVSSVAKPVPSRYVEACFGRIAIVFVGFLGCEGVFSHFLPRRRQRCTTQVAVDPRNDFAVVDPNRSLLLVIRIVTEHTCWARCCEKHGMRGPKMHQSYLGKEFSLHDLAD